MQPYKSPTLHLAELRGNPEWCFQTDRYEIYRKLKRRKGFRLASYGYNCDLWVFVKSYKQPKKCERLSNESVVGKYCLTLLRVYMRQKKCDPTGTESRGLDYAF